MTQILIVDDSSFARSKLRRSLDEAGYEVVEAAGGAQAVEMVKENVPDLVTLDLLMPGMSGLETLQHIREIAPDLKVIIVTADIQTETQEELLAAGANGFLNKPVVVENLLDTIKNLL
jgi:CheY-like chemotaxis protein